MLTVQPGNLMTVKEKGPMGFTPIGPTFAIATPSATGLGSLMTLSLMTLK
jgi:hypothetical protein